MGLVFLVARIRVFIGWRFVDIGLKKIKKNKLKKLYIYIYIYRLSMFGTMKAFHVEGTF